MHLILQLPKYEVCWAGQGAHLLAGAGGGHVVHGAQQREQHAPPGLLPLLRRQRAAVRHHHAEQRPHAAVAHLRPPVGAQVLRRAVTHKALVEA